MHFFYGLGHYEMNPCNNVSFLIMGDTLHSYDSIWIVLYLIIDWFVKVKSVGSNFLLNLSNQRYLQLKIWIFYVMGDDLTSILVVTKWSLDDRICRKNLENIHHLLSWFDEIGQPTVIIIFTCVYSSIWKAYFEIIDLWNDRKLEAWSLQEF